MGPSARRRGCTRAQLPIELQGASFSTEGHNTPRAQGFQRLGRWLSRQVWFLTAWPAANWLFLHLQDCFLFHLLYKKGERTTGERRAPPRKHKPTSRVPQLPGPCPLLLGMMRDSISFLFVAVHLLSFTNNAYVLIHTTTWWNLSQTLSGQLATHLAG